MMPLTLNRSCSVRSSPSSGGVLKRRGPQAAGSSSGGVLKRRGLDIYGAFFNADSAFDTKEARKTCFNHGLVPNIPENRRNRKGAKRGRPRLYHKEVYKRRFVAERSFAWVDKFKSLLIRFERSDTYFFGAHAIAFAMINLRHIIT
jgi:Transposase DDE domain